MTAYRKSYDDDNGDEVYLSKLRDDWPKQAGMIVAAVALAVLLYASIAYVPAGHVGVLTLFGRVTGDVLPEGTHLVNPFKVNNKMSVRTHEL
jgi:regulator of protease activity HflC (stomatin/prohibitin superfamily)